MSQLTIRNIPPAVEARLRLEASRTGSSLNRTVIHLLTKATGVQPSQGPKRDLSKLAGRWDVAQTTAFERATEIFEQVDQELWQ